MEVIDKACQGLAEELEIRGFYVRRFDGSPIMFQIMNKPWNEEDEDIALCFTVHAQEDVFLFADHMSYFDDAKSTALIPYDVPDMLDRIVHHVGNCPRRS